MKTELVLMLEDIINNDNISAVRGILDYLENENSILGQYKYRQLYSAYGLLFLRLKYYELPEPMKGKIISLTKEQIFKDDTKSLIVPKDVNITAMSINEWNYNKVLRSLARFKNRIREIFWEDLTPIETTIPLIQSIIEYAKERRDKTIIKDESVMQYGFTHDVINTPTDENVDSD